MNDVVDLLVIGGGMAGMSAAARAARRGLEVVVVESGPELGGSALYAGYLWTAPTIEAMCEANPDGDPALAEAVVDGFGQAVAFLDELGVPYGPAVPILRFGRGHQFDTALFIDTCRRAVLASGGSVLLSTTTETLLTDATGAVVGAEVTVAGGAPRRIHAGATLLATGGFQADPDRRAELVGPQARDMPLRSNPRSEGEGLRLARVAGGALGNAGGGFYGHLVPAHVTLEPEHFVDLALYYSEHALLFNLRGERFIDETLGDHLTANALLEQPGSRGLLVTDARGYREFVCGAYVEGAASTDKFALADRRGGRCVMADDADDFAAMPPEWGYDGERIAEEVARCAHGEALTPGRTHDPRPLDEPPYYVVETVPAITFPFAGIRIDARARVQAADGGTVPGLYAAGSDIGGLYVGAYAGGLAPAVVFGLAAADDTASVAR
ncbi:FAD-dependent oxidoreductase [Actinomycetospora termitidis]|uniref:FAD-dependent oxidoreductase n=1 Tax=Actinomycetospora termitidis TaxID=3053470 RepID=A0ABT7M8G0_9PSEU|nr:FAD-dependent oxidoreductase [Actinomycetospora sp. Odt1-22]MDL5156062.1 FAD-dependent oxidoreductase [Actinomycetospora sp. Odt1-22]